MRKYNVIKSHFYVFLTYASTLTSLCVVMVRIWDRHKKYSFNTVYTI